MVVHYCWRCSSYMRLRCRATRTVRGHRDEFLETAEAHLLFELDDNDEWTVSRLHPAEVRNTLTRELIESGNPGLVVFSSGSTGKHKAILHDVDALLEKFHVQRHRRCTLTSSAA